MTDRLVVLMVVLFLGLTTMIGLVGTIYLIVHGVDNASLLLAVSSPSSTALGGLIALLVSTHSTPPKPPVDNVPVDVVAPHAHVDVPAPGA